MTDFGPIISSVPSAPVKHVGRNKRASLRAGGMTEREDSHWQPVSEWDAGLKMMQEWKLGAEGKASVCKGIWEKGVGHRPAIKEEVRTLQTLKSDECKPIAFRS